MILSGKYELVKPINSGRYGTVYLANRVTAPDQQRAIKILLKSRHDMDPFINKVTTQNEITNMKRVTDNPHKNIVQLNEILEDQYAYYLVEELCGGNTLQQDIYNILNFEQYIKPISNVIDAIVHCHDNDILFCDIKPANVVYSTQDNVYKLTDFGSSTWLNPKTKEGVVFTTTPVIAPPEAFKSKTRPIVTTKFDVYSIGILAKTLLVSNPSLYNTPVNHEYLEAFILACLHENEKKRLDSSQMKEFWYDIIRTIDENKQR